MEELHCAGQSAGPEDLKAWYFTAALSTASQMRQLEVPPSFTRRTKWPQSCDCSFALSSTSEQWPVRFEVHGDSCCNRTWVSVGEGYSEFLAANDVSPPALLVFEVVDPSTLVVTIHLDSNPPGEESLPPASYEEDRPHFSKTLRACHVRPLKSTRLDVPTAYWRSVGEQKFDGNWYTLVGPLQTVLVKSSLYVSKVQTFCHFTKGWVDFVALNRLKRGDSLVFAATAEAEFEVKKL